ncbi:MAG TPA: extracellular solute-binding protein [Abditibacteriaceae bacterium]|jgi:ABC-type Fe3+ transport system substrate-binding protein
MNYPKTTLFPRRAACLSALLALGASTLFAGCGDKGTAGNTTSNGATTAASGASAAGANELMIISPHGREVQAEFERVFIAKNPGVKLTWIDQGGSSDDLRFVQTEFAGKKPDEGIGLDLFFGGGPESFLEMSKAGLLQPLKSTYNIPAQLNGMPLRGAKNEWVGATLSGFGILYNKSIATRDKLPVPTQWADLGKPELRNRIILADPRHSGSAHMAYEIILQANGWKRGWEILTAMTGNTRTYASSGSQVPNDVASGEAVMGPAIDFYAATKIASAGEGKLGYAESKGQRVVTPDPIGVLRGAPHADLAHRFVDFVMSPEGQKLWMLKKGSPGGPQNNELFRKPILPSLYKPISKDSLIRDNPYAGRNDFVFDPNKAGVRRRALDDLLGAVLIDNADAVKAKLAKSPDAAKLAFVPVTEAELAELSKKWDDQTFRNARVSEWGEAARKHFSS